MKKLKFCLTQVKCSIVLKVLGISNNFMPVSQYVYDIVCNHCYNDINWNSGFGKNVTHEPFNVPKYNL